MHLNPAGMRCESLAVLVSDSRFQNFRAVARRPESINGPGSTLRQALGVELVICIVYAWTADCTPTQCSTTWTVNEV